MFFCVSTKDESIIRINQFQNFSFLWLSPLFTVSIISAVNPLVSHTEAGLWDPLILTNASASDTPALLKTVPLLCSHRVRTALPRVRLVSFPLPSHERVGTGRVERGQGTTRGVSSIHLSHNTFKLRTIHISLGGHSS